MRRFILSTILGVLILSACVNAPTPTTAPTEVQTPTLELITSTPESSPTEPIQSTPTITPVDQVTVFIDTAVPTDLRENFMVLRTLDDPTAAAARLEMVKDGEAGADWIFALTAPFSSLVDEMTLLNLVSAWQGRSPNTPFVVEQSTFESMSRILGQAGPNVKILPAEELLAAAWDAPDTLAIVPFEALEPRWKVIAVEGQSPVRNDFMAETYPLKIRFGWQGGTDTLAALDAGIANGVIPELVGNRDPERLTVLIMTGVTALVRATAVKMEEKGMTYPGEAVRDWLVNADLTHISNEVSFTPVCPDPVPYPGPLFFCSKVEYLELLDDVGTDIIELTGNHGVDWGRDALTYSIEQYQQRGWAYYAAGEDVFKAREAVTIEHNGNKLAFIGCNPAGPEFIWATETLSGVANCDYPWMWQRIRELTEDGYQVIATFQYFETYRHYVEPFEERDFRSMAEAGAKIVSGSQAHHPMAMEFFQGSFIHYGLGNLFFDQMHTGGLIPDATRKEFLDRQVFYNNRHISTELLTAMLEDYARPRPMSPAERKDFLTEIFAVTRWGDVP